MFQIRSKGIFKVCNVCVTLAESGEWVMPGRVVVKTDFWQGPRTRATHSRHGAEDMLKEKEASGRGSPGWLAAGSSG